MVSYSSPAAGETYYRQSLVISLDQTSLCQCGKSKCEGIKFW